MKLSSPLKVSVKLRLLRSMLLNYRSLGMLPLVLLLVVQLSLT